MNVVDSSGWMEFFKTGPNGLIFKPVIEDRARSDERFNKHSLVITAVAALLTALCAPAWAINKCKASDGKVVYRDASCAGNGETIDVRPNSLFVPLGAAPKRTHAAPEVPTSDGHQTPVAQQPSPAQSPPHT